MNYPIFNPPLDCKPSSEWSKLESDTYFKWIKDSIELRTDSMLSTMGLSYLQKPSELLNKIDSKVNQLFIDIEYSTLSEEKRILTIAGCSLAADMGLLLARLLIESSNSKVKWKIIKSKSAVAYNLPVLCGDGKMYWDPIGGLLSEVKYSLLEKIKLTPLQDIYEYWFRTLTTN